MFRFTIRDFCGSGNEEAPQTLTTLSFGWGQIKMSRADEYRRYAAECLRLANENPRSWGSNHTLPSIDDTPLNAFGSPTKTRAPK
jgi:hypothetical protein